MGLFSLTHSPHVSVKITMHTEHESPMHPLLDELIKNYKHFSQVEFPRGIPGDASQWRALLQQITKYEAICIQEVHKYLSGNKANSEVARCPSTLKKQLEGYVTTDSQAREFSNKLLAYVKHVENLGHLLEDSTTTLGNPCSVFRNEAAQGVSLKQK